MANRSIAIRMRADVSGFTAEMAKARSSLDQVVKAADKNARVADTAGGRMVQSARLQADEWNRVGNTLTVVGGAGVAALGGATKAAISYESAFAGVRKTVDGTPAQMDKLSNSIRSMSREMPASQTEIAGVAEAAGQLGIEVPNIEGFTKTMIAMGSSTNIAAADAATELARFANIMGTSQTEFSNMGSSIVALGNNFATTESEITNMALNLASAGHQAGMTEGDIFGIATALSSVGIEAQAGGTAFSKVMLEMNNSVKSGNDKLEVFAQTAGMTADEFSKLWQSNPSEALTKFVQGLADIENQGGNTQPILDQLGMTDVRVGNALRSSAAAADTFTDAISMGNDAYSENTALMDEYSQRVETAESQLQIFKNTVVDLGISLGSTLLPALNLVVGGAADLVGGIADLPEPVLAVGTYLGGAAAMATLAGGAFFKLAPSVIQTWTAFGNLANTIPGVSKVLGGLKRPANAAMGGLKFLGKWVGIPAAAIATVGSLTKGLLEATGVIDRTVQSTEELTNSLMNAGNGGKSFYDSIVAPIGDISTNQFSDLAEVFERIAKPSVADGLSNTFSFMDATGFQEVKEQMEVLDQQITSLAQTDLSSATSQFKGMFDEMGGGAENFANMMEVMPGYKAELTDLATQLGIADTNSNLMKIATGEMNGELKSTLDSSELAQYGLGGVSDEMEETKTASEEAADALNEYLDVLASYAELNMSADEASLNYMDTLNGLQDAYAQAAEGVTDLNELDLVRKTTLGELASASQTQIDAMHAQTDAEGNLLYTSAEIGAQAASNADDFIAQAQAMGLSGDAAVDLASDYGVIPADVNTKAEFEKWKAEQEVNGYSALIETEDGKVLWATAEFESENAHIGVKLLGEQYNELDGKTLTTRPFFDSGKATGDVADYNTGLGLLPKSTSTTPYFFGSKANREVNGYDKNIGGIPLAWDTTPYFNSRKATRKVNSHKSNVDSIPTSKTTKIYANDYASSVIGGIKDALAGVKSKTVTLTTRKVEGKAGGGPIYGPGTGTSDDVPIMASNGEYMIRESATRKNRRLLDMINYGGFDAQSALGLAEGGPVDRSTMTPVSRLLPVQSFVQSPQAITVSGPRSVTVVDADGNLVGTMRTVAVDESIKAVNAL